MYRICSNSTITYSFPFILQRLFNQTELNHHSLYTTSTINLKPKNAALQLEHCNNISGKNLAGKFRNWFHWKLVKTNSPFPVSTIPVFSSLDLFPASALSKQLISNCKHLNHCITDRNRHSNFFPERKISLRWTYIQEHARLPKHCSPATKQSLKIQFCLK